MYLVSFSCTGNLRSWSSSEKEHNPQAVEDNKMLLLTFALILRAIRTQSPSSYPISSSDLITSKDFFPNPFFEYLHQSNMSMPPPATVPIPYNSSNPKDDRYRWCCKCGPDNSTGVRIDGGPKNCPKCGHKWCNSCYNGPYGVLSFDQYKARAAKGGGSKP